MRRARLVTQRRPVPDAAAFEGWLRSTVVLGYLAGIRRATPDRLHREAVDAALRALRNSDDSYDQDFVRVDLMAVRP